MTNLPAARTLRRAASEEASDHVTLDYDGRLLRRKRLAADSGALFLVDLPETTGVEEGDCFELEDGSLIAVRAADEALVAISGDLPRLAWHIGNRHTPCQIGEGRLVIRADTVLEQMLEGLGATLSRITGPFTPEGGAYGHGRTMGHEHGPGEHEHHHAHHHSAHHHLSDEEEDGDEPEVVR